MSEKNKHQAAIDELWGKLEQQLRDQGSDDDQFGDVYPSALDPSFYDWHKANGFAPFHAILDMAANLRVVPPIVLLEMLWSGFDRYLDAKGDLSLEEALFGLAPVKKAGNYAKRFSDSLKSILVHNYVAAAVSKPGVTVNEATLSVGDLLGRSGEQGGTVEKAYYAGQKAGLLPPSEPDDPHPKRLGGHTTFIIKAPEE